MNILQNNGFAVLIIENGRDKLCSASLMKFEFMVSIGHGLSYFLLWSKNVKMVPKIGVLHI